MNFYLVKKEVIPYPGMAKLHTLTARVAKAGIYRAHFDFAQPKLTRQISIHNTN